MAAPAESQLAVRAYVGGVEVDIPPFELPPGKSMMQFLGEALAVAKRYHSSPGERGGGERHDIGLRLVQVPRRGHVGTTRRPAAKPTASRGSDSADPDLGDEPPGHRPPSREGAVV